MRVKSNQDGVEDGVYYFLTDHLGSTAITLDSGANKVAELRYSAWGETRYTSGATPTQRRYTGQLEAEAGLYFYNARWFDPSLGRFSQADTIIPGAGKVLAWDRYAGMVNNPVRYNDPTGHCPLCFSAIIGGAVGALVGAIGYTAYAAISGTQFTIGTMLIAAGGGMAAGALIGTGVGWAAGIGAAEATAVAVTGAGALGAANAACGGDMCASEAQDAPRAAQVILPAVGNAASQATTTISTGLNVVYRYVENGVVKYYGITNDFARRAAEHFNGKGWTIEKIPGLDLLSRYDARAVEQVLIQSSGLQNLYNKINSIATSNDIYIQAIQRGTYILQHIGLIPK